MYNFEEQYEKGKPWEEHFFRYLDGKNQMPKYNNFGGENKAYDIEANGVKYEVKSDHKDNKTLPIEIFHFWPADLKFYCGWLFQTESNFVVFYKTERQEMIFLHAQTLFDFVQTLIPKRRVIPTYNLDKNVDKITYNMPIEMDELDNAQIIKRVEHYLQ